MVTFFRKLWILLARAGIFISQLDLARALLREKRYNIFSADSESETDSRHLLIENNSADTTLFVFSSSALLYAGQPSFEFRGLFEDSKESLNLVFFRDLHRMAYHLDPDGNPGGLSYYESELRSIMDKLGSSKNIIMGDSSGASAAMYFGARCGMDKVIALAPAFPLRARIAPLALLRDFFDIRLFVKSPTGYWQNISLSLLSIVQALKLMLQMGRSGIWNPVDELSQASSRPDTVIFYGDQCKADSHVAHLLVDTKSVRLVPVPTWKHSIGVHLARKGILKQTIRTEIDNLVPVNTSRSRVILEAFTC